MGQAAQEQEGAEGQGAVQRGAEGRCGAARSGGGGAGRDEGRRVTAGERLFLQRLKSSAECSPGAACVSPLQQAASLSSLILLAWDVVFVCRSGTYGLCALHGAPSRSACRTVHPPSGVALG